MPEPHIDRDPSHLYPSFRKKMIAILGELNHFLAAHAQGWRAQLGEGFRSVARQGTLYAKGRVNGKVVDKTRVVTYRDGVRSRSEHQSGLAADVWLTQNGKAYWGANPPAGAYEYLGHLARKHNLTWGGSFKNLYDPGHIEWPAADKETYRSARAFVKSFELGP